MAVLNTEANEVGDLGSPSSSTSMTIKIRTKEEFLIILILGLKKSQMENAMFNLSSNYWTI
jgi:hypothetical protein